MKKIFIPFLFLLFFCSIASGQENKVEFQLEPAGTIFYSKNGSNKLLNDFGLSYQRYVFPKTYIIFGVQGNFKNYTDQCNECPDNYAGSLKNRTLLSTFGVRYLFFEEVVETWNIMTEVNFYYTGINATGSYTHNTVGDSIFVYNRYNGVGLGFKAGTIYQFNSPYYIGANIGLYFGGGRLRTLQTSYEATQEQFELLRELENDRLTRPALELRVGYRF